ncbi:hypothetical protein D1007_30424 [Hordeum vulgare]|nr:hypothetical protein D1007_30424 [Hordeum vulgare]
MAAGGRALLVALLAVACAAAAVVVGDTAPACDGISCGMGTCKVPLLPNPYGYECDCNLGWFRLNLLPITPCSLPICPSDISCHMPKLKPLPIGKNFTTDACSAVDCGPEGTCVEEESSPYFRCQCNPGTANARNDPSLWCTNCVVSDNGCAVPPPPPSPPSAGSPPPPSMAPTGNDHDSSAPPASSITKGNAVAASLGSVSLRNLPRLLVLVASLAALHIV